MDDVVIGWLLWTIICFILIMGCIHIPYFGYIVLSAVIGAFIAGRLC